MESPIVVPPSFFGEENPLWKASLREGLSPALAWLDLVSLAAPTDCDQQVGEHVVPLKRGEILASVRFLARRWNWGGASGAATGRVRRFLALVAEQGLIEKVRETNAGMVLRIVGYDSYRPSARPETPKPRQRKAPEQEAALELALTPQEEAKASEYPQEFEAFWQAYPRREGGNSKKAAFRKWQALRKRGVSAADLLRAARGYAAEQERLGNIGTRFVKQCSTFLGPDEHWKQYVEAAEKLRPRVQQKASAPRILDGYSAAEEAERLALARLKLAVGY